MQIPNLQSSSQYWIDWHKFLIKEIGKANANDTFMRALRGNILAFRVLPTLGKV